MKHVIYLTTNLINNKQYIGSHSTNNLNDKYLGSGKYLKRAFKKYGRKKFKKEILEQFKTKEEAFQNEEYHIQKNNTLVPHGYNLNKNGGLGINNKSYKLSEEHKNKIRIAHLGKPHPHSGHKITQEIKEKISKSQQGKIPWMKGKKHTEESKNKMSDANKGNIPWIKGKKHSKETKEKISLKAKERLKNLENNGMHEKKHTSKTIEKMKKNHANVSGKNNPMYGYISEKLNCPYCNRMIDKRQFKHWHGENCKFNC